MSNFTLQENLRRLCSDYKKGTLPLRELARQVAIHAAAFEAFPFTQRKALEKISFDLERQADYADEDCEIQESLESILASLDECLLKIPI